MVKIKRSLEDTNSSIYAPNGAYTLQGGIPIRTVTLPNITITGSYHKYLNAKNEKWKDKYFRPIGKMLGWSNDNYVDSYKNATVPYGKGLGHERDNIIQIKNGISGQMDRLGMYGAEKGKDGVYRFRNPNYIPGDKDIQELKSLFGLEKASDNEFLKWCAENANRVNSALRKPTAGNAWDRHGIYGDSLIIQSPVKKKDYRSAKFLAGDQGRYIADNIDNHDLKTGDIVDMYYRGSSHLSRAFREGDQNRTNSHTGTILKTGPDKEHTYVVHSTGNGLNVQPIGELLGGGFFDKSYITGIRRPGTKNHPYKRNLEDVGNK